MATLDIKTEADFERLMAAIDDELRNDNIGVPWRPIQGICKVGNRFGLELTLTPQDREPIPGRYEGDDLSIRILRWFRSRYGDRLKVDWSRGRMLILIKGDPYLAIIPMIFGAAELVCDPGTHRQNRGNVFSSVGLPRYNVLDAIKDLTPKTARSLSRSELKQIWQKYWAGLESYGAVAGVKSPALWREVQGDLNIAADLAVQHNPRLGQSRWASLQAAEKAIKSFLELKMQSVPKSHDLSKLVKCALPAGFVPVPPSLLAKIQCEAAVRYEEVVSTLQQAVDAHDAALSVCGHVAQQLPRESGLELSRRRS